jgi:hypothetical protein
MGRPDDVADGLPTQPGGRAMRLNGMILLCLPRTMTLQARNQTERCSWDLFSFRHSTSPSVSFQSAIKRYTPGVAIVHRYRYY